MMERNSWFLISFQLFMFVLFVAIGVYGKKQQDVLRSDYGLFQDIHVMIFVGFGFLMVFLRKYGYSAVGFNFLLAALILQWSVLCQGFFELNDDYKIEIGLTSMYRADIATATVLISMGAVLGRTSHVQLVVMGILEIIAYCLNTTINTKYLKAVDAGGSMLVHAFGAYFGLAVSYIIGRKRKTSDVSERIENLQESSYVSNILAMIGTLFLWVYWPSFNAIDLEDEKAHRAVVNTYLSLAASCVIAFSVSQMSSKGQKFDMVHIQNSTLAGGVAIGACTHLMVQPFGAVLVGMFAGGLSVFGYTTISAVLERKLGIQDTCGIHNLHGMPGVFGGIVAVVMASIANEGQYGKTIYAVYPAMASRVISFNSEYIRLEPGDGRTAGEQAEYQTWLLLVTVVIAIVSGIVSGFVMNLSLWSDISAESFYDDSVYWDLPINNHDPEDPQPVRWRLEDKMYDNSNNKISEISI